MRYKNESAGLDLSENEPFSIHVVALDDTIKYPRNWFKNATAEQIAALGFTAYEPEPIVPDPPSTNPIDYTLTRRQLRLGLLDLGVTDVQVVAAINAIPDATERAAAVIEWEDADDYNFDHPLVVSLMAAVGLDEVSASAAWLAAKDL